MPSQANIIKIIASALPIVLMIGLIPFVDNDYLLTGAYIVIIVAWMMTKREKNDFLFLLFGFFAMIISEYFFVSTGVEAFTRNSLLGVMPLWLPFLWAYAFVAIKRSIVILMEENA